MYFWLILSICFVIGGGLYLTGIILERSKKNKPGEESQSVTIDPNVYPSNTPKLAMFQIVLTTSDPLTTPSMYVRLAAEAFRASHIHEINGFALSASVITKESWVDEESRPPETSSRNTTVMLMTVKFNDNPMAPRAFYSYLVEDLTNSLQTVVKKQIYEHELDEYGFEYDYKVEIDKVWNFI